jgi:phosphomannomutase
MIKARGFTVAVDAVNGAGSIALPQLLETLGVNVHRLHCEPNGIFPHNPEPLPEHLTEISDFVKNNNCDLGLVTDPDGDRLALVDENGKLFGEEYTQAAAFDLCLHTNPATQPPTSLLRVLQTISLKNMDLPATGLPWEKSTLLK